MRTRPLVLTTESARHPFRQSLPRHVFRVMDATAISLCRENKLPILVFNLTTPGSILKALQGEPIGTLVKGD